MSRNDRDQIVVIGAGFSGLAAAWRIAQAGHRVRVIERSQRVGGRAASDEVDGFHFDGPMSWLSSCDRRLLAWIDELGVAEYLLPWRPLHIAQVHHGRADAIDEDRIRGLARISGLRPRDALRALRLPRLMRRYAPLLDRDRPERAASLDSRSVADFGRLYFGASALDRWIGPAATCASGADERELSRVSFLFDWQVSQQGRPVLARAGMSRLATAAAARLSISLDTEALEVSSKDGRFIVHTSSDGDGRSIDAAAVVVAAAGREAGQLAGSIATPAERDFFAGLESFPALILWAALDRPLTGVPQLVRVPRREVSPLASYLLEPGAAEGRVPTGYGLATLVARCEYSKAQHGASDEVIEKDLRAALTRLHPWVSIRFTGLAQQELPQLHVGHYSALARFRAVQQDRRRLGRRLYFAGDYLAGLRAEDAIGSGLRAARELLSDLEAD